MTLGGPDDPVFREAWEARAFALHRTLGERGLFTPSEWATALADAIGKAQAAGDPDAGDTYYSHMLAALERLVAEKDVTTTEDLRRTRDAWEAAAHRTPHGKPVELTPADFAR